eukprot:1722670-Alexandrium_andersonii.AAC.1
MSAGIVRPLPPSSLLDVGNRCPTAGFGFCQAHPLFSGFVGRAGAPTASACPPFGGPRGKGCKRGDGLPELAHIMWPCTRHTRALEPHQMPAPVRSPFGPPTRAPM